MVTVNQLTKNIKNYIDFQLRSMSMNNPMIAFAKPLITRAIDKKLLGLKDTLNLISDNEGFIDIENIITEMMDTVISSSNFNIEVPMLGTMSVGNGCIKLNIPYTDNMLVLNQEDLNTLKEMLIIKN